MPSDFAAALSDLVLSMALSKRHLPSPKTPSAAGVDSQSFNFGDNADVFVLFIRTLKTPQLAFGDLDFSGVADPGNLRQSNPKLFGKPERLRTGQ
ncbi:MAG: hypothetical protein L6437_15400 [Kiritimatiellae bacterium]|nr:hypothetical protein [Kiritimatiellia bacterium]